MPKLSRVETSSTTPLVFDKLGGRRFVAAAMNKTFTPELDPGTLRRLEVYAAHFADVIEAPETGPV